eukprot:m.233669 g.233669  ORF g.233669 m.233669 type:complete len:617 (-) comp19258_c0_seq1:26-1876(-)
MVRAAVFVLVFALVVQIPFVSRLLYHVPIAGKILGTRPPFEMRASYDYIVVGAGSAGAVVAARLSEDPNVEVLLIEAGEDSENMTHSIPIASALLQRTNVDWMYRTEPLEHTGFGLNNRVSFWPRGRVLGGSSILNYMAYVRGHPSDYDGWAEEAGDDRWSYENMLSVFKKSEHFHGEGDEGFHGDSGDLDVTVGRPETANPITNAFIEATHEILNIPKGDYNGREQVRVGLTQTTITPQGQREHTARAFLDPVRHRPNLHIATHTQVTRILFDVACPSHTPDCSPRASGVSFVSMNGPNAGPGRVTATREIILSAGAIGSPHLLLLSGVGPEEHLKKFGIPVVRAAAGVGRNLQDHLMAPLTFDVQPGHTISPARVQGLSVLTEYLTKGTGLMRSNGIESTAFMRTKLADPAGPPDIQFHTLPACTDSIAHANLNMNMSALNARGASSECESIFSVLVILLHPKSHGYVELRSGDPFDHPRIQPNYLKDRRDLETLIEGMKAAARIGQSRHMEAINASLKRFRSEHEMHSDAFWEDVLHHLVFTVYHPTSTCKMGQASDPSAVVDSHLRVIGVHGLRVADASVFPRITSGNTNAPAIAVGEMAAALVRRGRPLGD